MSSADWSHVVFYVILGLTALGVVSGLGAMFSLGRSGYKKD